jgi:hypothetical protein
MSQTSDEETLQMSPDQDQDQFIQTLLDYTDDEEEPRPVFVCSIHEGPCPRLCPEVVEAGSAYGFPPPPWMMCPITRKIMKDPVVDVNSGITYEAAAWRDMEGGRDGELCVANLAIKHAIKWYGRLCHKIIFH